MQRLDKILSKQLNISRTEAKALLRQGVVSVNGQAVSSGEIKCSDTDIISVEGKELTGSKFVYIMMNKPKGVICATEDKSDKTVIDLIPDEMKRKGLFPAGRLDKDTTGFALITDDGAFAHAMLSPKRHVDKTYVAVLDRPIDSTVAEDFKNGMTLGEEKLLGAELESINEDGTKVKIVIRQGIYHQIKRMFKKHGITVLELKRTKIGSLELDTSLKEGDCRFITAVELEKIL